LAQYNAAYDRSWGRFKTISRPVIGNHEYGSPRARGYFDYFGNERVRVARVGTPGLSAPGT
jgi:hypothetical protein